jgi:prepilin-type N-terminal cleavage/methylation domain-containing protein
MLAGIRSATFRISDRVLTARAAARPTKRRQSGLTLVELLVALALLGFVLLGIAPLFVASVKSNYAGNEYTSIHVLARDRLELLMSMPFSDAQLAPGTHDNDLSITLPDPRTGLPPARGGVRNPFRICYRIFQLQIPSCDLSTVPQNAPFTPKLIAGVGEVFHYKRIDVTVISGTGALGVGARKARVSGVVSNPAPEAIFSAADPGGTCP